MEIRTQINQLSEDVRKVAQDIDGKEKNDLSSDYSELSNRIFIYLDKYDKTEKSLKGRVETLENLSSALQELAGKITGMKGFFERFATRFGFCMNESEKVLWKSIDQVNLCKNKESSCFLFELARKIGDLFNRVIVSIVVWAMEQMTLYRMKECAFRTLSHIGVLDGIGLDSRLEGAPPIIPIRSIQRDLERFMNIHEKELTSDYKLMLTQTIAQLQFAEKIEIDTILFRMKDGSEIYLADQVYNIEKEIERLEVGQSVIIPGGYNGKGLGHGVIFEVQRLGTDNYRFVTYNSGEGAMLGSGFFDTVKSLWNWSISPKGYENLSKEAVSDQKFLMNILRFKFQGNRHKDPMSKLVSLIQDHCEETHHGKNVSLKTYELQTWGTCAFTPIMHYLKEKLPKDLYRAVEVHMVKEAREELNTLIPKARFYNLFDSKTIDFIDQESRKRVCREDKTPFRLQSKAEVPA